VRVSLNRGNHKNLVLTRIGVGHRLHALLNVDPDARTWDLAVSLYDEEVRRETGGADLIHYFKGGKWDGIHQLFTERPELLDSYEYFWLVDDDIEAAPEQVDALFAYVRSHEFEIAQPGLTPDSYYSHRITLQCPGFRHRLANFVELMMPVLSAGVLKQVMPYFENTHSGLGLDWFWNRFASSPATSIAIIDAIAVAHRRPLHRHLRGRMQLAGRSASEEKRNTVQTLNLSRVYPISFAGVTVDGGRVHSRVLLAWMMARAYWTVRDEIINPGWRRVDFVAFMFLQALWRV